LCPSLYKRGVAKSGSSAEHTERLILCSSCSGGRDGSSQNRSASNANLFYNSPVWGLSRAPSTHRRPRRTGKWVDCEQNNGGAVPWGSGVADTRRSRSCARLCINVGSRAPVRKPVLDQKERSRYASAYRTSREANRGHIYIVRGAWCPMLLSTPVSYKQKSLLRRPKELRVRVSGRSCDSESDRPGPGFKLKNY